MPLPCLLIALVDARGRIQAYAQQKQQRQDEQEAQKAAKQGVADRCVAPPAQACHAKRVMYAELDACPI